MSRWIDQKNGKIVETIADMEQCYWLWNEMCCNDSSDLFADYPYAFVEEGYCKKCPFFTKEDGSL